MRGSQPHGRTRWLGAYAYMVKVSKWCVLGCAAGALQRTESKCAEDGQGGLISDYTDGIHIHVMGGVGSGSSLSSWAGRMKGAD